MKSNHTKLPIRRPVKEISNRINMSTSNVEGDAGGFTQEIDILRTTTGSEIMTTAENDKEIEDFSSEELNHAQDLLKSADLDPCLKTILGACLKRVIERGDLLNQIREEVEYHFSDFFLVTSSDDWARRVTNGDFVSLSTISTLKRVQNLTSNLIAEGLQTSSKIVMDQHEQRIRLRDPIDKTALDESKSRIIVVEDVTVSDEELKKLYSKFGKVIRVRSCQSSGSLIAFLEYEEADDAIEAIKLVKSFSGRAQLLRGYWGQSANDGDHFVNDITRTHCAGLQSPRRTLSQASSNSENSISDFARTHYAGLEIAEGTLFTAKLYYKSFKDSFKKMVNDEKIKMSVFFAGIEEDDPLTSRELGIKEGTMKKKESMVAHLKADSSIVFLKESVVKPTKIAVRYCCRLGIVDGQEIGRICRAADRVSSIQLSYRPKEDTIACAVILGAKPELMAPISRVSGLQSKTIMRLHRELKGHHNILFQEQDGASGASAQ